MPRPSPEHEEVIRVIRDIVESILEERLPTMGTVAGMDAGRVRVHLDDEEEERVVGFPRKKGQQYATGERVVVMPTRSGDYVALGTVTDKQGKAGAGVGDDDLINDYADRRFIARKPGSDKDEEYDTIGLVKKLINGIGASELAANAVTEEKITNKSVTGAKLAEGSVAGAAVKPVDGGGRIVSGSIGENDLADKAVTSRKLADTYAKDSHKHSEYASSTHSHKIASKDLASIVRKEALDMKSGDQYELATKKYVKDEIAAALKPASSSGGSNR